MVKDILHLQNLEALDGLGTAFEALLAIDSTRTGGDVVDCFIKFIEYAANATFPSNSSSEAPAVATGPRSALKMKYWNLLAYLSVTDAPTIDTILQTKVDLSTLYLQSKDDSAERTKCRIASILCGIMESVIMDHSASREKEPVDGLPNVMLEAWDSLDHEEIQRLVQEDICMLNDCKDALATPLSLQLSSIIEYLLCAETPFSKGCKVVLDTLLNTMKQWTDSSISNREHVMDLLCLLATRFDHLKETDELLLSFVQQPLADRPQIMSLESFFHFVCSVSEALLHNVDRKPSDAALSGSKTGVMSEELFSQTNTGQPKDIVLEFLDEVSTTLKWVTMQARDIPLESHEDAQVVVNQNGEGEPSDKADEKMSEEKYEVKLKMKIQQEREKIYSSLMTFATLTFLGGSSTELSDHPIPTTDTVTTSSLSSSPTSSPKQNSQPSPIPLAIPRKKSIHDFKTLPSLHRSKVKIFLKRARAAYGRTALCLSGRGMMGNYHFGAVKALLDAGLLPDIISGTSAGSVMRALLCTRTDVR